MMGFAWVYNIVPRGNIVYELEILCSPINKKFDSVLHLSLNLFSLKCFSWSKLTTWASIIMIKILIYCTH